MNTRPITAADRTPLPGDMVSAAGTFWLFKVVPAGCNCKRSVPPAFWIAKPGGYSEAVYPTRDAPLSIYTYYSRADGGPVGVDIEEATP